MQPSKQINVHPLDHAPAQLAQREFDVICIGSGWAGRIAAARIVAAGHTALIVEDELVGGDCPFWACVPSKVLLQPPQQDDRKSNKPHAEALFERRDKFTAKGDDSVLLVPMVEGAGVTIARGVGSIAGVKRVRITPVGGEAIIVEARLAVVIATGSRPFLPDIQGLQEANVWTPRDATSSSHVPQHLIIMGAGAVGTEMATAYCSLGSQVTLISSSAEILPAVDPQAGEVVRKSLLQRGIKVHVSIRVKGVRRQADGSVFVELSNGETIHGSELLIAAGRLGNHENLELSNIGLQIKGKSIPVKDNLAVVGVEGDWLYAGGDVNGRALLTHTSKHDGRLLAQAILAANGAKNKPSSARHNFGPVVPQVIFTDPPVSSVGLTMRSAKLTGRTVREITAPFITLGGRINSDEAVEGWAQWLLDEDERLVGATFVGHGAADVLHASTVAIVGGLTLGQLALAIPSFPTVSEVYLNLLDASGV